MVNRGNNHRRHHRIRKAYQRDDVHGLEIQQLLDILKGQREIEGEADKTQDGDHIDSADESGKPLSPATSNSYMLVFERNPMQTGNEGQRKSQIPEAVLRYHRPEIL